MTEPEDESQRCPRCQGIRTPEAFLAPGGLTHKTCRPCRDRARQDNRQRRDRIGAEGVQAENLRTKYGISVQEYDLLRAAQGYRCAICRRHEDEIPGVRLGRPRLDGKPTAEPFKLVVDHCHDSRRVRGLLCTGCNSAIGHFRDDPAALRAALAYLDQ